MAKFHEHPDYRDHKDKWELFHDLYEGNRSRFLRSDYLPYHQLEKRQNGGTELRSIREKNTFYTNFVNPMLDIWRGLFFRKSSQVSDAAVEMLGEDMLADLDGQGSSVDGFLRKSVFTNDYLYGRPIILVDAPSVTVESLAEQQAMGARAFITCLDPRQVKDWQIDPVTHQLQRMRYEYTSVKPRSSLADKPEEVIFSRIFSKTSNGFESIVYEKDGDSDEWRERADLSGETTGFDTLPVVWTKFSESSVNDYYQEVLRHHILESSLDNGLAYQAWQRLYVSGMATADADQKAALSAYTVFFLPDDATMGSVEPPNPKALVDRIGSQRDLVFKKAMRQLRQLPSDSRAAQGADTLRAEQDNTIAIIQSRLEDYEQIMNEAFRLAGLYFGKEDEEAVVTLDKDITDKDVQQTLLLFQSLRNDLGEKGRKQFLKALVADSPIEDVDEVREEIEASESANPTRTRLGDLLNAESGS